MTTPSAIREAWERRRGEGATEVRWNAEARLRHHRPRPILEHVVEGSTAAATIGKSQAGAARPEELDGNRTRGEQALHRADRAARRRGHHGQVEDPWAAPRSPSFFAGAVNSRRSRRSDPHAAQAKVTTLTDALVSRHLESPDSRNTSSPVCSRRRWQFMQRFILAAQAPMANLGSIG